MVLSDGMFSAAEMVAGGDVDFEAMKVAQLKAELAERGSTRTGLKAVLQRRLHALIMQVWRESCRRARWTNLSSVLSTALSALYKSHTQRRESRGTRAHRGPQI